MSGSVRVILQKVWSGHEGCHPFKVLRLMNVCLKLRAKTGARLSRARPILSSMTG